MCIRDRPLLRDIEMPLVEVLVDMEWDGIAIDREVFARLGDELGSDMRRLESEIAAVGWIVSTSLLARMTENRIVRSFIAPSSWSGSSRPYRSTGSSTISNPN